MDKYDMIALAMVVAVILTIFSGQILELPIFKEHAPITEESEIDVEIVDKMVVKNKFKVVFEYEDVNHSDNISEHDYINTDIGDTLKAKLTVRTYKNGEVDKVIYIPYIQENR